MAYYPNCVNRHDRVEVPTLVLSGEQDDWTPAAACVDWSKRVHDGSELTVVVYPNAYHSFDKPRTHDVPGRGYQMHHLEPNAAATADASTRMEAFFSKWLKVEGRVRSHHGPLTLNPPKACECRWVPDTETRVSTAPAP